MNRRSETSKHANFRAELPISSKSLVVIPQSIVSRGDVQVTQFTEYTTQRNYGSTKTNFLASGCEGGILCVCPIDGKKTTIKLSSRFHILPYCSGLQTE